MKILFTGFLIERDPAGNLAVELRMAIGMMLIGFVLAPFIMAAGYVLAGAPLGYSWMVLGGWIFFVVLDALGIALIHWQHSKSRVRVCIDRAKSRVLIDAHSGHSELAIRDVEKADFGSIPSARAPAVMLYRLEFVSRTGGRTPSTDVYCNASLAARAQLLKALNDELRVRNAMLQ